MGKQCRMYRLGLRKMAAGLWQKVVSILLKKNLHTCAGSSPFSKHKLDRAYEVLEAALARVILPLPVVVVDLTAEFFSNSSSRRSHSLCQPSARCLPPLSSQHPCGRLREVCAALRSSPTPPQLVVLCGAPRVTLADSASTAPAFSTHTRTMRFTCSISRQQAAMALIVGRRFANAFVAAPRGGVIPGSTAFAMAPPSASG